MEERVNNKIEVQASEIEQQKLLMNRINEMTQTLQKQPLAYVDTYGCQQNEADR
jgi:hypothetical protein